MKPSEPLVLAIDLGTSSARAMVFDSHGRALPGCRAQQKVELVTEPPGSAILDADSLVETAAKCIDEALHALGARAERIVAAGCCTFWHSMAGVDARRKAFTPLYTWADTRSADAARQLAAEIPGGVAGYHARTGCALHPSYFPARLRWLADSDPTLFNRAARWLSPGEYLYDRLFGEARCSVSMASGTGLFDQNRCAWDDETLASLRITPQNLAPVTVDDRPQRGLVDPWRSRWPSLAAIPWALAIGDGAASNAGSGCVTNKRVAINLGTSGAIRVCWRAQNIEIPPELWCYRLDSERFVMGAAFSDGGSVYAWMRRVLALEMDESAIDAELEERDPDFHGLTFLPFLSGERSMGWRPEACASLHGLTLSTEPLDVLQAGMEGVALRFALAHGILRERFPEAEEIIASGGALGESRAWARMMADALGRPIILSSESEASSRGAALVALRAAGALEDEGDAPASPGELIEPRPSRHRAFARALERQERLNHLLAAEDQHPPPSQDQSPCA